jgi:nucleoside-diphosphate-sugar epimerase
VLRIAVTGATGHLGQVMLTHLTRLGVQFTTIGRRIPTNLRADVIFHLAAPNHKDAQACSQFTAFNQDLRLWTDRNSAQVINTASWWQHAGPDAESLFYTQAKAAQQVMFADHTTLTLFSVYGDAQRDNRGFIPQLLQHLEGRKALLGVSDQARDFIHTDDVCGAYMAAIGAPVGNYDIGTHLALSPETLLQVFSDDIVGLYVDKPDARCHWPNQRLPKWCAETAVTSYIAKTSRSSSWQLQTATAL